MAIEAETPATRTRPEAELVAEAGGSDGCPVRLSVANVFNNRTQEVTIHSTSTIGDLKAMIQKVFDNKPASQQQRLIFRGKHCEDTQQLGHILRGLDLSSQHSMHLIVTQPLGQTTRSQPSSTANPERSHQHQGSSIGGDTSLPAGPTERPPPRIELTALQVEQLRWQYEHALWEIRRAFAAQRQQYEFITGMSAALDWQLGNASGLGQPQSSSQQSVWRPSAAMESEVATVVATRALGGNMPGPAAGAAVRDVTGPPPEGFIPAAGLDVNGEEGRGNIVDPAPRAPDLRREARGYFKMLLQCLGVVIIFGIDADGWILVLLALGGFAALLYKTGLLETMLGGGQGRGGLWKALCRAATVITDGGGLLMDIRFICSAFFLSLFPTWKPKRSAEAIAAEAAAREASQAAEAAAREATLAADAATQETTRDAEAVAQEPARDAEAAALEAVRDAEATAQEAVQAAEAATELARVAEVVAAEAAAQEAVQATEAATGLSRVAEVVAAEAEVVAAEAEAKAEAAEVMTVEAAKAVAEEAERTPAVIPSVQATDVGEDGARLAPSEVD